MKVVVFLVSFVIFLASFAAFGYAFEVGDQNALAGAALFLGGILGVSVSFMIPFHLLPALD
ncbi:hypothetical protein [Protaetiibacter mangrovi]|uniref:Uncharacterized protein n=1 Tax=Protaetiibacter mangrovi TaxID=2970926 RepID=A0ABT1ZIK8_9MICO|nr:hypothetical protein [Protaetiibacter mangrovi]MCS0500540.1 hypothetical protein [Protaetiibacter mangrovi]TPX03465.1 hypothetical protein FJ656_17045 [Schumannella luteola]